MIAFCLILKITLQVSIPAIWNLFPEIQTATEIFIDSANLTSTSSDVQTITTNFPITFSSTPQLGVSVTNYRSK
jgi:hypothetical protein